MTSREKEDAHEAILEQLLAESGLKCDRTPPEVTVSTITVEDGEASGLEEEEALPTPETKIEEEENPEEEEVAEILPDVFPSPSLRRMVPDALRKIEAYNRIHVLPEEFNTNIDPQAIPKIDSTPPQEYIDIIAELVGCTMYKRSLPEFWFLDTMANLLRRAQKDLLHKPTQAVLMLWFCEWMKEMQNFDAADRKRMMKRFQDNMLTAARILTMTEVLPTPADAGVYYIATEDKTDNTLSKSQLKDSKHLVTFEGAAYECTLMDLTKIIHYIYDLFSTDYQYNLVRSVFTSTPEYIHIDAPFQLQNPKRMYNVLKPKPKGKEKDLPKRDGKSTPVKGKKKEQIVETKEFLLLLERKAKEDLYLDELEAADQENWNRRNCILPLSFAGTEEVCNRYWPPPPPPPEPEPQVDTARGKGKPKGKK